MNPRARHRDLIVESLEGEALVYDRRTHHAHHLNRAVTEVWHACDGTHSEAQLVETVSAALGDSFDRARLGMALEQLQEAGLLEEAEYVEPTASLGRPETRPRALTRRRVLKGITIGIPLVTTILAPTIADAASCPGAIPCTRFTKGQPCQNRSGQCGICRGLGLCR